MQFIINGFDGTDAQAPGRRLAARELHLAGIKSLKEQGRILFAAARLDATQKMIGSLLIADFPSRDALNDWLKNEPYVLQNVWQRVEIEDCKVAPLFNPNLTS